MKYLRETFPRARALKAEQAKQGSENPGARGFSVRHKMPLSIELNAAPLQSRWFYRHCDSLSSTWHPRNILKGMRGVDVLSVFTSLRHEIIFDMRSKGALVPTV
jgi:hypothetical protein